MLQFKNDISFDDAPKSRDEGYVSETKKKEADRAYEMYLSDYFSNDVSDKGQFDTPKDIKSKNSDFESVLSALQKDIINDPSSHSSKEVNESRRMSADEALEKALNDPGSFVDQTESGEDADEVRELCDDIKRGVDNDDDVIVHEGLYPEYEEMIEFGEYENEEDLCNGEGLDYGEIFDDRSERYGDEYEQGFRDGWDSVGDESHNNEAYNKGVNDAERLSSLCGQYYSEEQHGDGTDGESGESTETKETRELTDEEKQKLKDTLGWSDKQIAKCTIDEDGVIHYRTDREDLEGKNSENGVPYERKTVEINGIKVEGVFPVFNSKFDAHLPDDLLKVSNPKQFSECNRQLKEAVENDPELAKEFTDEQLEDIENGDTPEGYTWHHNEETGKMQLVKTEDHDRTQGGAAHTGGKALWGGQYDGTANTEQADTDQDNSEV